jgi:hypothetical protein
MKLQGLIAVSIAALGLCTAAIADNGLPARTAPLPVIAKLYLKEIAESKARPISVHCVNFPPWLYPGYKVLGLAFIRGNALYLSTKYVCEPLAAAYRNAPIFTCHAQASMPLAAVDAVETVAHEWFHTRGVSNEERTECHAVQYTWKWLRRGDLSSAFLLRAKRYLLDNRLRPPAYKIPPNCLGPT